MRVETISGAHNWKLTYRLLPEGAEVLRAVTCDAAAALPGEAGGAPVIELGDHALAPDAPDPAGETLTIMGGPDNGVPWDNRALRALTLPAGLRRVGNYGLYGCSALKTLRLWDGVEFWGGGALMNCSGLDTLVIHDRGRGEETLAYFADELSRELDATLLSPDGGALRLIFPEYTEIYEENCPAHHFDYTIDGGGYGYHHCLRGRRLRPAEYDALWPAFLRQEHDPACALRLACCRLRYPVGLTPEAEAAYLAELRGRTAEVVRYLAEQRALEGLGALVRRLEPDRAELSAACAAARELGSAEALAPLLEEQHRRFSSGAARTFDL